MTTDQRKTIFIVGNGPIKNDLSDMVDQSDLVVRFNEPKLSKEFSGTRTDLLFVCNSGKPMQRRLSDPAYFNSPIVQGASQVVFAYHPQIIAEYFRQPHLLSRLKGRRGDWTLQAIDAFGAAGKAILLLPPHFYRDGCDVLGIPEAKRREIFPSTGYFGLTYILQNFDPAEWMIVLCGFTWEGWKRHAWGDERQWVMDKVEQGILNIIV
jgi:hypothetical protein